MEAVELLQQDLAIEPDLQNFIGFVLESVESLGASAFAASIAVLDVMQRLRDDGAAAGQPLAVSMCLQHGRQLQIHWPGQSAVIASFSQAPSKEAVAQLRHHLQNSTVLADPDILLQRNAEMVRYYDEVRVRNEREMEVLQRAMAKRQSELRVSMHQAETDPLTGLLNRRAFDERLSRAFHHIMRQKNEPLSLALFDLDHFKEVNDEFGHQFGDTYLIKMADVLRSVVREDVDFAFRFGGDEFALVIFADSSLVCDKAMQVLQLMENKVSVGISAIDADTTDDLTLEEFIRRADNAMYQAKHQGRGRVVVDGIAAEVGNE